MAVSLKKLIREFAKDAGPGDWFFKEGEVEIILEALMTRHALERMAKIRNECGDDFPYLQPDPEGGWAAQYFPLRLYGVGLTPLEAIEHLLKLIKEGK